MIKIYFRIAAYSVISTPSSVLYFGGFLGYTDLGGSTDKVAEFKNMKWNILGNLASPRHGHRSIQMRNKIYIFGHHADPLEPK